MVGRADADEGGAGRARRGGRGRVAVLVWMVSWLVILGSIGGVVFGVVWADDPGDTSRVSGALAWVSLMCVVFRFHLGLGLLVVCAAAVLARARVAAVAAGLMAVVLLGERGVMYSPWRGDTGIGRDLRVMSVNLLYGRGDPERLMAQIGEEGPDVVVIQEYTPDLEAGFFDRMSAEYPYSRRAARTDAFGIALFSRHPFVGEAEIWRGDGGEFVPTVECVLDVGGRKVGVWGVHVVPPTSIGWVIEQRSHIAAIARRVDARFARGDLDGVIVAGDFNAVSMSNHVREVRACAGGLVEAHAAVGVGAGSTWAARGRRAWVPGVRIDHVFVGGGLVPVRSAVGGAIGSDHYPVVADVRFYE